MGAQRRAILAHSPELHASHAASFTGTALAKACRKLDELAATLARGKTRLPRAKVEAEIAVITRTTPGRGGSSPGSWTASAARRPPPHLAASTPPPAPPSKTSCFGKHVLITEPRRLARRRRHRRLPVPVRGRVLLPAAQRPPRRVLQPDVPLDRAQHPRPRLHPAYSRCRARPPHAPPRRPERAEAIRPRAARQNSPA